MSQRRNELNRQKRIRAQNERALVAARDRSRRVEALVSEMRADLKSLKERLDDELSELGEDRKVLFWSCGWKLTDAYRY